MGTEKRDADQIRKQMQKAKGFIDKGQYDKARRILVTIDHPTAEKWLERIESITAQTPQTVIVQEKKTGGCTRIFAAIGLLFVCAIVFGALAAGGGSPSSSGSAASGSAAGSGDAAPEAGSRSAPFEVGSIQSVEDGRLQVNGIQYDMTDAVREMNMFNTLPEDGQEWVLVNLTFYCDLPDDDTCNTSFMRFELVGDAGKIYDKELISDIDQNFSGEIFGGGSNTGNVGFIIDSDDTNLLLIVNERGNRLFFDLP